LQAATLRQWISVPAAAAVLLVCGVLTHTQVSYWKDNETLWTHTIKIFPDNYIGYLHLGDLRWSQNDYAGTVANLTTTLQKKRGLQNFNPDAYCMLGKALLATNRPAEAEHNLLEALKQDTLAAKHHYEEALRLNPDDQEAQQRLELLNRP
jgi:hypothetical protein